MHNFLIFLFLLAGRTSVAPASPTAAPTASDTTEFRGLFSMGFEEVAFSPCGSSERWWIADLGPLARQYRDLGVQEYEPVMVVVRGDTSKLGRVGHMGMFQRYMKVYEVRSIKRVEQDSVPCRRPVKDWR